MYQQEEGADPVALQPPGRALLFPGGEGNGKEQKENTQS